MHIELNIDDFYEILKSAKKILPTRKKQLPPHPDHGLQIAADVEKGVVVWGDRRDESLYFFPEAEVQSGGHASVSLRPIKKAVYKVKSNHETIAIRKDGDEVEFDFGPGSFREDILKEDDEDPPLDLSLTDTSVIPFDRADDLFGPIRNVAFCADPGSDAKPYYKDVSFQVIDGRVSACASRGPVLGVSKIDDSIRLRDQIDDRGEVHFSVESAENARKILSTSTPIDVELTDDSMLVAQSDDLRFIYEISFSIGDYPMIDEKITTWKSETSWSYDLPSSELKSGINFLDVRQDGDVLDLDLQPGGLIMHDDDSGTVYEVEGEWKDGSDVSGSMFRLDMNDLSDMVSRSDRETITMKGGGVPILFDDESNLWVFVPVSS